MLRKTLVQRVRDYASSKLSHNNTIFICFKIDMQAREVLIASFVVFVIYSFRRFSRIFLVLN